MKDILLIVPSRGRQEKIVLFKKYFDMNSTIADLCLGIDDDEYDSYPKFDNVIYDINPNMKLGPKLNVIANKYCSSYRYIGFMGDDHWIKTYAWDQKIIEPIKNIKYGMSYGNDLIQKELLPTAIIMSSEIILKLGYMCPPNQQHLYLDDFWLRLGKTLGTIYYCDDIIIEHMHFSAGKSKLDDIYSEVNSPSLYQSDLKEYENYLSNNFKSDIEKLSS